MRIDTNKFRATSLVLLMVLMTQTGYIENFEPSSIGDNISEYTNARSNSNSLTPSVEGADLLIDQEMTDITFQYNGSGSVMESGVPVSLMLGGGEYCNVEHAIDSNDRHHLIHFNCRQSDGLHYTTNSGGYWTTTTLDSGTYALGYKSDIEVDSNNNPHVVYEAGTVGLNYTYFSNGVWSTPTTIDILTQNEPKLVIDSNDNMHVVSVKRLCAGCAANYTTNVGGSWVSESFATNSFQYPHMADIALNSLGNVSIAYIASHGSPSNNPSKSLTVYDKNGSTWDSEQIEFSQSLGYYKTEIGFDQYDARHLYYYSQGHQIINDASGTWSSNLCINLCGGGGSGNVADMKIEPNGTTHLVYKSGTTSPYKFIHSTNTTGSWAWEEIANITTPSVMPTYNALELDSQGNLHYFFRDNGSFSNGTLYHLVENGVSAVGGGSSGSGTTTYGNGSTWMAADISGGASISYYPGSYMEILVGDTIYFDADDWYDGHELWAHDTSNHSTWQVADINPGSQSSNPGFSGMTILVGDTIYFSANGGSSGGTSYGNELWAHDTSNGSTWRVTDVWNGSGNSNPGQYMSTLVGDTIYFSANNATFGTEMWAHDTSNHSTWLVDDLGTGNNGNGAGGSNPGIWLEILVGDTLYFSANGGSTGHELWAHDTSNHSTWRVADISSSGDGNPGRYMQQLVGDTIYFSATDGTGDELWAYSTSNHTIWQVANINAFESSPGLYLSILVGDTIYFDASGNLGRELWAHDTSNHSTWMVVDITTGDSNPGYYSEILVGDTLYFTAKHGASNDMELWAHDTSNHSTWQVADIRSGQFSSTAGQYMMLLVGDTLYFDADDGSSGKELWAHDTSNHSTWQVADIQPSSSSLPGQHMAMFVGDTIYFDADDGTNGRELWAHRPGEITSLSSGSGSNGHSGDVSGAFCSVSPALPNGLSINQGNCTISGTPLIESSNTTYTVTALVDSITYETTIWLSSTYLSTLDASVDGAEFFVGEVAQDITFEWSESSSHIGPTSYNGNGSIWLVEDLLSTGTLYVTRDIIAHGDRIYFDAKGDNDGGWELFVYDTSNQSTWMLADISSAPSGSPSPQGFGSNPLDLYMFGDKLMFTYQIGQGTSILRQFGYYNTSTGYLNLSDNPQNGIFESRYNPILPYSTYLRGNYLSTGDGRMVHIGDSLFFEATAANDSNYWSHMWEHNFSNGTTSRVTDICPKCTFDNNADLGFPGAEEPKDLIVVGDQIFFTARSDTTGITPVNGWYSMNSNDDQRQLWVYDTSNRTYWQVALPTTNSAYYNLDEGMVEVDGTLYFSSESPLSTSYELFAYNIDNETFWQAADIGVQNYDTNIRKLTVVGSSIVFSAHTSSNTPYELWVHETKNGSTWQVSDFNNANSVHFSQSYGTTSLDERGVIGTRLYFEGRTPSTGYELFAYDSTNYSVWLVSDSYPGTFNSGPGPIIAWNNTVYFHANTPTTGEAFFALDPSNLSLVNIDSNSKVPVTNATCAVIPSLPAGLQLNQGDCTISGTPLIDTPIANYRIWANASHGNYTTSIWLKISSFSNIDSSLDGAALELGKEMTPIVLNYTSQAPQVSTIYGNGSLWNTAPDASNSWTGAGIHANSEPGLRLSIVVGDTIYFDADCGTSNQRLCNGRELWAYDTSNGTAWLAADIGPSFFTGLPGSDWEKAHLIGDTIYFPAASEGASNQNKFELHAFDTSNQSWWKVTNGTQTYSPFSEFSQVVGDTLFFAYNDQITGYELWAHRPSNGSTWQVADINSGLGSSSPGERLSQVIDDVLYFSAYESSQHHIWAHDPSNGSTWKNSDNVAVSCTPASSVACRNVVVDDVIYFSGIEIFPNWQSATNGTELWAYDISNGSSWRLSDMNNMNSQENGNSDPGKNFMINIGDEIYFDAQGYADTQGNGGNWWSGREVWAHNITNETTWLAYDVYVETGMNPTGVNPGYELAHAIGDKLYFDVEDGSTSYPTGLHVYDTSTHEAWNIPEITGIHGQFNSQSIVFGNNLLFSGNDPHNDPCWESSSPQGQTFFIHSQSNNTTWQPHNCVTAPLDFIGENMMLIVGNNLYFSMDNLYGYSPLELTMGTPPPITWEIEPSLPAGMSISGGTISGTPMVYANNQTYTIYANQSDHTTIHEMWFSVNTDEPHTVVEGQPIDPIGFHSPFWNGSTNWCCTASLPQDLSMNVLTGEITGIMNQTIANTTITVSATHTESGIVEYFTFNLVGLSDTDGDGDPDILPSDYDPTDPFTSGLVEDTDDDNDGLPDLNETNTGTYLNESDTGSNSLDPDSDDDGICDGPLTVLDVCFAGPDSDPNGELSQTNIFGINNTPITTIYPIAYITGSTYDISPTLPSNLLFNTTTGEINGTPIEKMANTTFTITINTPYGDQISWNITIEILEDTDDDGLPDELPIDYPIDGEFIEDTDDDNDGIDDVTELQSTPATDPRNPDTDGDGVCDGAIPVLPDCEWGPDAFPTDPSADTDTDGDGLPDTINGTSTTGLIEDLDDDGDGLDDVNETNDGTYDGPSDTGTDPKDPDTDNDGICDGPNEVIPICSAGPDETPLGTPATGMIYGLNNSKFSSLTPPVLDDQETTWEISPNLPLGMEIDPITGLISGTPIETFENTTFTLYGNSSTSSITFEFNLQILEDSDLDGEPNQLPTDYPVNGEFIEDIDDDNDGVLDTAEDSTGTNPSNPDTDNDGICDGEVDVTPICIAGPDDNPFGIEELNPAVFVNKSSSMFTPSNQVPGATWEISPQLPAGLNFDSETGTISGVPLEVTENVMFTIWANTSTSSIESTVWLQVIEDTDNDGKPDQLPENYPTNGILIEDLDDDNDGALDVVETGTGVYVDSSDLGTDPLHPDTDGDGFCDGPYVVEGICVAAPDSSPLNSSLPLNTDGDEYPDEDPDGEGGLIADPDDDNDGFTDIREIECGSDPLDPNSTPDEDSEGNCGTSVSATIPLPDAGLSWMWCFLCLFLLLLLLLIPLFFGRSQVLALLPGGPEPENTTSKPLFVSGSGTKDDPFILKPLKGVKPGTTHISKEVITITEMAKINVDMADFNQEQNSDRFGMCEAYLENEFTRIMPVKGNGEITINIMFDDKKSPTYEGGKYVGNLKLGRASVYLSWIVEINQDKAKMKEIEREKAAAAKKKSEEEAAAKKKSEEEAAAATAKKTEKKPATKEVKKQEELQRIKSRAKTIDFKTLGKATTSTLKTEVKKGASTLEVSNASEFTESGTAAISDEEGRSIITWTGKNGNTLTGVKGVTRIFGTASIVTVKDDLQVIKGIGPFIEEKLNALGITIYRQIANMDAKLETQVNEAIEFFPGRVKRDEWAKQAKELSKST